MGTRSQATETPAIAGRSGEVSSASAKKKQPLDISFIHSSLDDYGLPPRHLKAYCHVSRRAGEDGVFFESVPNAAKHCGMHAKTLQPILSRLVDLCLLNRTEQPGRTSHYTLTPPSIWKPSPYRKNDPAVKPGRVENTVATTQQHQTDQP